MKNSMMKTAANCLLIASALFLNSCSKDSNKDEVIVIKANGNINDKLNQFRNILGVQLNITPGATGGRREINWDGVPAEFVNKALPNDFFNSTATDAPASRQRGLTYAAVTGQFMVSNTSFAEINSGAANQFSAFSGDKVFANTSSSLWDAEFEVPGRAEKATIKGFGLVVADVDVENSTFVEFFSESKSLGKFFIPAKSAESNFSFLGVYFKNEKISRIRIGHDGRLNEGINDVSNGGTRDLIVFDDFLYDEPVKK